MQGWKSTNACSGRLWLVKACCVIFLVDFIVILFLLGKVCDLHPSEVMKINEGERS